MFMMEATMNETRPVLIVGAGPTGLTAALELKRLGIPVRLVDQYMAPSDISRALAVHSRTVELMQQRGMADAMLALGNKGYAARLHDGQTLLGEIDLHAIDSRFNFVLLLSQSETERILREHLAQVGVEVERATQMVAFTQGEEAAAGVCATLRKADGALEEVDAAYLVDAEGAHSTARHSLQLAFEGKSLPNTYLIADLYIDGAVPEDALSIFLPEAGLVAAFPMGGRRFRVLATERHDVPRGAPAPGLDAIEAAWARSSPISVAFRDLQWSAHFRINSRALHCLRHGSVFFAGDAAHIHSPAGGQGMNTGMQDAINLSWKLALVYRGLASDALLDTYDEERLPVIHQLISTTERATDLFNANSRFVHTLLRHMLPVVLNIDAVRRKGAAMLSELSVHYRASALNGRSDGAVRAGERFPDVAITEDGARTLDLLDPSRFTVFTTGRATLQLAPFGDMVTVRHVPTPGAALQAALGEATVAVVRPDGYLLCAGSTAQVQDQLREWAARWLNGPRPLRHRPSDRPDRAGGSSAPH
jgi:2-polyprenyl-6-methoxyphenol hydroxylase-like FAD-dependent oxidoreductase